MPSSDFFTLSLHDALPILLSVVYLIFNEGYTATSGGEWMRAALCDEALRLGRMLVQLLPGESEVHALLALMELNASRTEFHQRDRKSTRLNSSHITISYAVLRFLHSFPTRRSSDLTFSGLPDFQ